MDRAAPTTGLSVVMLGVRDLARSLAFYRDVLGFPVAYATDEFAFVSAGGVSIGLRHAASLAEAREDGRTELVLGVEDIDRAHALLQGRGVVFRIAPRVVTAEKLAADFRDPDGHVLSIFGPRQAREGASKEERR